MELSHDPDPARAATLPPRLYTDPAMLALEQEWVFGRSWQLAARADQLARSGDQVAVEVAGEPVAIVRDGDALRGFYNVCRHRAGPVAVGCARRNTLQCAYHGWTYSLAGELIAAPDMDGVEGFRREDWPLSPVRVEGWGPLVLVSLEPRAPLAEVLAGIDTGAGTGTSTDLRWVMRRDYHVACNWKVYVDNYLEGYHIPFVHPELMRELDYRRYRTEVHHHWSRQHAPLRPVEGDAGERHYRPEQGSDDARYYWVFPNLMLNVYQGQLQTNLVEPLGVDATRVVFDWYAASPPADPETDPVWRRLVELSDLLQHQDAAICAAVQRGLRSRACRPGRYSARREAGVHHFHGLLRDHLRDAPGAFDARD